MGSCGDKIAAYLHNPEAPQRGMGVELALIAILSFVMFLLSINLSGARFGMGFSNFFAVLVLGIYALFSYAVVFKRCSSFALGIVVGGGVCLAALMLVMAIYWGEASNCNDCENRMEKNLASAVTETLFFLLLLHALHVGVSKNLLLPSPEANAPLAEPSPAVYYAREEEQRRQATAPVLGADATAPPADEEHGAGASSVPYTDMNAHSADL